ncbi:DoxX family protein [Flavobacterium johnsoniae]|uniref:DoxX family protein n=1 Tax=Flavobacterium johnsoniae TaxID=986 RepID=UPI001F374CCF|nr:DoxX family protein [Flavobacterium johnsoniae]WQG80743.1 DoxX family protein [Flavobacterium johnsoniae UW101]
MDQDDLKKRVCLCLIFLGNFVGTFEIVFGALILFGLLTRPASIPPIIIMLAAAATAKSEVLAQKGFWEMMHGSRTDCNAFGKHFLSIKGAGYGSVDNILTKNGD